MISSFLEIYPHILLTLFNCILEKNITIDEWTVGIITAIYKNKGSRADPENYRGISLLSCLGKFFTGILYNRLLKFCIENKILAHPQLGFFPGNRTSDAHMIIHNLVRKQCHNNGKWLYSCFIDFSKAFPSGSKPCSQSPCKPGFYLRDRPEKKAKAKARTRAKEKGKGKDIRSNRV